ncbi:DUF2179 domain-containing protein [Plebeiibacterium sediminum]|uniref:UPF0316 protein OM075_23745 n=1 Tax=Plebeiibacterium sediminum TaxID=2992112 RepID=A0AAE3SHF2_9BACT|nr:DUF2179 domain-containing protein [Plebeiobacterium sediminum]MCW3789493.1 DUF2179 domain-containing protein [Plebeiobacterium sediminum]
MFDYYAFIILPILIFLARVADVSLGTIRIILVEKGFKNWAPVLGFFEVLIWILAISEIIENLDNWVCYFAYAGGFAAGNYIGMKIEKRLALGHELLRVITKHDAKELVNDLKDEGYGVTFLKGEGIKGAVGVVYIIVNRKKIDNAIKIIHEHNPNALYTIEDVRFVNKNIFFTPNPLKRKRAAIRK